MGSSAVLVGGRHVGAQDGVDAGMAVLLSLTLSVVLHSRWLLTTGKLSVLTIGLGDKVAVLLPGLG